MKHPKGKKIGVVLGLSIKKLYCLIAEKKDYYHKITNEKAKTDKISEIVGRGREEAWVETKQFGGGCREIKSNNTRDGDRLWS